MESIVSVFVQLQVDGFYAKLFLSASEVLVHFANAEYLDIIAYRINFTVIENNPMDTKSAIMQIRGIMLLLKTLVFLIAYKLTN